MYKGQETSEGAQLFGGISDQSSCSEEWKWGKTRKVGQDQILKGLLSLLGVGALHPKSSEGAIESFLSFVLWRYHCGALREWAEVGETDWKQGDAFQSY